MSNVVKVGRVEWSGDNPFIYLKRDSEDHWATLALSFRVTISDFGPGHAMLVLEDPFEESNSAKKERFCATDNVELARFLVSNFVKRFGVFRNLSVLEDIPYVPARDFKQLGDGREVYLESCIMEQDARSVRMQWEDMGPAFAVDVPPDESSTGKHEMLSVFRVASRASVTVDGRRLAGEPVEREFFGTQSQSAGVALSETWIRS